MRAVRPHHVYTTIPASFCFFFFVFLCGSFPEVVLCTLHLTGIPQFFALLLLLLLDICVMQVLCLWCGNTPPVTLSLLVAIVASQKNLFLQRTSM